MSIARAPFVFAIVAVVAGRSHAQSLLREHHNALFGLGIGVSGIADVDADGVNDYLLLRFANPSNVQLRSGATGASLFDVGLGNYLSSRVVIGGAGDLDGDGVPDFLVGNVEADDPTQTIHSCGAVYAYSGADGHNLLALYGGAADDGLGVSVASVGDVDGDGSCDFIAGAIQIGDNGVVVGNGYVRCYSGSSGSILYQVNGAFLADGFGWSLCALSDHDGDQIRDFAANEATGTRICSGASGGTIASIPPAAGRSPFGGLAELDDLDGDGEPEIAIGEDDSSNNDGEVHVISIPTQTEIRVHLGDEPEGWFGWVMTSVADADGDGFRDYLVGAPAQFGYRGFGGPGSASLFSGRTGERLYRFVDPDATYWMGWSVADAGDLDGDGFSEMMVGSPSHQNAVSQGAVFVYRGNDLWLNAEPKSPIAGATESLITHGAPTGNPIALFLTDVSGTPITQLLAYGFADSVESFTLSGTVPSGLAGTTMTFHSYALDANSKVISSADETIRFQ